MDAAEVATCLLGYAYRSLEWRDQAAVWVWQQQTELEQLRGLLSPAGFDAAVKSCEGEAVKNLSAEVERLRQENEGYKMANELLRKGMESQCELMDAAKQEGRRLRATLRGIRDMAADEWRRGDYPPDSHLPRIVADVDAALGEPGATPSPPSGSPGIQPAGGHDNG